MTDKGNERGRAAYTELADLADWIEDQLGATAISRQVIAEQAAARIRETAGWLRGAAGPGENGDAAEARLAEAERVIMEALAAGPAQMPPSVLLRAHEELLRQSRWLLGVVLGDPRLAQTTLRRRPEDERAALAAALNAELPASADDFDRGVAASLAEWAADDSAQIVTAWLRQARAEGAAGSEAVQRRVLDEAVGHALDEAQAAYGESLRQSRDARKAGDDDGQAGT